jgi:hypothetical protein
MQNSIWITVYYSINHTFDKATKFTLEVSSFGGMLKILDLSNPQIHH